MRALIIVSASLETVMAPSSTWRDEFLHQVLAAFPGGGIARHAAFLDYLVEQTALDDGFSGGLRPPRRPVADHSLEPPIPISLRSLASLSLSVTDSRSSFLQLVVALHAPAQVRQPVAQFQQFPQRPHLAGHVLRREIVHALEIQVDLQLRSVGIFAELVFHRVGQVRLHVRQHGIEIVRVYLNEFPVLDPREGFCRLAGEIAQHPHHEGQFLHFDGVADFHVIGDLYAWRADTIEFMLRALSSP